jgi:predicted nuclease of predicted toxin-antitoxin system
VARFYSNENIALQVVIELRRLGHDVLTSLEAGNANASVPDPEVLAFASSRQRILLTHNRRHFLKLHTGRSGKPLRHRSLHVRSGFHRTGKQN